jgi:hypothetical protein
MPSSILPSYDDAIIEQDAVSEPPMKRFLKWPYYRPPPGWVLHPAWNIHIQAPNWTSFVPPDMSPSQLSAFGLPSPVYSNTEMTSPPLWLDTNSSTVQRLQDARPSPFFAHTLLSNVVDPRFISYREAQASSRTSFHVASFYQL